MLLFSSILFFVGILLPIVFLGFKGYKASTIWPLLNWFAAVMIILSFFLLKWVNFGPPESFFENARWIISNTKIIDHFNTFPLFHGYFSQISSPTVEDIYNYFSLPVEKEIIYWAEQSKNVRCFDLINTFFQYSLNLAILLLVASITSLIAALVSLVRVVQDRYYPIPLQRIFFLLIGICFIGLIGTVPYLDSFGVSDNFKIRLLSTFTQTKLGIGVWFMLGGLLLEIISLVPVWIPGLYNSKEDEFSLSID